MRKLFFLLNSLFILALAYSQDKRYSNELEVEFLNAENGSVCFIIYNYCRRDRKCLEGAKIDAVKMVLFRGFNNANKIYPIVRDYQSQQKFKSYFDVFFQRNGQYLNYIVSSEDTDVESVKISRKKKKSAMKVCVQRDNLLKEMQNQKIIKKLDNGF